MIGFHQKQRAMQGEDRPVIGISGPTLEATETPARWRMAVLLASSALLSGIAVVLWNRRSLERIRAMGADAPPSSPSSPAEFI